MNDYYVQTTDRTEHPLESHVSRQRKATHKNESKTGTSALLDMLSGFSSVNIHKRRYYKRIKLHNMKRAKGVYFRQRMNAILKFMFYILSNLINVVNILVYIGQTYTDKNTDEEFKTISQVFASIEIFCSFYFLAEFGIFCFNAKVSFLRHLLSWDSFIDLVTILPSLIAYFITSYRVKITMRIFRVLRILRIYKSLKQLQYETGEEMGINIFISSNPIKFQFIMILVIFFCLFFICSGLVLGFQDLVDHAFNKTEITFADAVYFIIITASTTGYGDIVPTHPITRLLIISLIFSIILIMSYQVTKLINLLKIWGNFVEYSYKNHVICILDKTIDLFLMLSEVKKSMSSQEIILISNDYNKLPSSEYPFNKVHVLQSATIDIETLDRANTKNAHCIYIFASKSFIDSEQSEKVNDFVILKINQYYGHIPIIVQTLYSERSFTQSFILNNGTIIPFPRIGSQNSLTQDRTRNDKNCVKTKKIIPIFRIKSLIISKSLFNPGYANFIQNLLFNDVKVPSDLDSYDTAMQAYFLGCENSIQIRKFPNFFVNCNFYEAIRIIYSKSIRDYLVKVIAHDIKDISRPVLLIGVVDMRRRSFINNENNNKVRIFPYDFQIFSNTLGVFISYEGGDYLDNLLSQFPNDEQSDSSPDKDEYIAPEREIKRRIAICEPSTNVRRGSMLSSTNVIRNIGSTPQKIVGENIPAGEGKTGLGLPTRHNTTKKQSETAPKAFQTSDGDPSADNIISQLNRLLDHKPRVKISEENVVEKSKMTPQKKEIDGDSNRNQDLLLLNKFQSSKVPAHERLHKTFYNKSSKNLPLFDQKMYEHEHDSSSNSNSNSCSNSNNDEIYSTEDIQQKSKDKEFFMKKKNLIYSGKETHLNEDTKRNILLLQSYNEKDIDNITQELEQTAERLYGSEEIFDHESDYVSDNRIIECAKNSISNMMSNHILILGYQDCLGRLIKLIAYHYPCKDICIMTSSNFDEKNIIKLLKQFKSLYYLKGEAENPLHLLNAGVQRTSHVIFLVESLFAKTNEDMSKLLAFKSIDYFFNTSMLLELWNHKSAKLLGYLPMDQDAKVISNEFIHSQFMAGRLLYLDHLDRLIAMANASEYKIDAWMELLGLGFKRTSSNVTLNVNKNPDGYPVTLTLDVPESYDGKEYFTLFTDLLCLRIPCLTLGIYVENPMTYLKLKSEGKINRNSKILELKITTSHKKQLVNMNAFDTIEKGYLDNLKALRDVSYNDKVILDYVDIRHPYLPVFITNPPPWFILNSSLKILVLYHYSPKVKGIVDFQKELFSKMKTWNKMEDYPKIEMSQRQENAYYCVHLLKNRLQKRYEDAFKNLEEKKIK